MTALDLEPAVSADEDLQRLVAPHDGGGPGGVLLVARDGRVESAVAFGRANLEHDVPNSLDSVFYIASTSKQFVAAAAAVLELDGRLDPDEPVARWVPEVAHLGDLRVHHLIHHTSGVRDKYSLGLLGRLPDEASSTDRGTARLLARQRGLNHEPGSRFMYSNSGYWLLAQVVERCSGEGLASFAERRLFAPLGMDGTRFRSDPSEVVPLRATGYAPAAAGSWRTEEYTRQSLGPGGVVSTAPSLARWGALHTLPEHAELARHLQRTRPLSDGSAGTYGYGVVVGEHAGRRLLQHAGGVEGFGAEMLQVPEEGMTVVCLSNRPAPLAPVLARAALDAVLPPARPRPPRPSGQAPCASPDLAGTYVDADDTSLLSIERDGADLVLGFQRSTWRRIAGEWTGPLPIELTPAGDRLAFRCGDQELLFTRLAPGPGPGSEQLCGRFRNDELDVALDVTREGESLRLRWPDGWSSSLDPVSDDVHLVHFLDPVCSAVVRTHRAADGRVDALRISVPRALGVVFERVPLG